jgi:hypothetical protein
VNKTRDRSIDVFKILLVFGMILCHTILLLKIYSFKTYILTVTINLITFSGFLFCFGYAVGIAYLKKQKENIIGKLIKNCFRTLIAFYISGIAFELLILKDYSIQTLFNTLLLNRMPGFSEFLAGFFLLNLLTLVFFNQLKCILSSKMLILLSITISLVATYMPYNEVPFTFLGLIIGSTHFSSFPIIQYLPYFLLGAYFQQTKMKFKLWHLIVTIICGLLFLKHVFIANTPPDRFPPSLLWIIGGAPILYGYYWLSKYLSHKINTNSWIYIAGEHTLFFLVISNIAIFILKGLFNIKTSLLTSLFIFTIIVSICYISSYVWKKLTFRY